MQSSFVHWCAECEISPTKCETGCIAQGWYKMAAYRSNLKAMGVYPCHYPLYRPSLGFIAEPENNVKISVSSRKNTFASTLNTLFSIYHVSQHDFENFSPYLAQNRVRIVKCVLFLLSFADFATRPRGGCRGEKILDQLMYSVS